MHLKFVILLLFFIAAGLVQAKRLPQNFDKPTYFKVLATGSVDDINNELTELDGAPANEKDAYQGTLLMKKAGLVARPADKLKYFKQGRIKLETALLKDSSNGAYHFLRLTIQEHAPKIVKYRNELEQDRELIINSFNNLPPDVQQAILDYSKNSKILHTKDFNFAKG